MRILKCFVLLSVCFCFMSCMTPIEDQYTLNELTTCNHGSIKTVKKNLLLMGYEIVSDDDQMISTNYKQDSRGYSSKIFSQVNVVKLGPKLIKFKVRERDIHKGTETDSAYVDSYGTSSSNYGYRSRQTGNARVVSYRTVTETDDSDRVYYQEEIDKYRMFKDQVCGTNVITEDEEEDDDEAISSSDTNKIKKNKKVKAKTKNKKKVKRNRIER